MVIGHSPIYILILSRPGGGGIRPPPKLRSPLSELDQILYENPPFEKSLSKFSSVSAKKLPHNDVINFFILRSSGILTLRHFDVKMTSYLKILMKLNSEPKITPLYQI